MKQLKIKLREIAKYKFCKILRFFFGSILNLVTFLQDNLAFQSMVKSRVSSLQYYKKNSVHRALLDGPYLPDKESLERTRISSFYKYFTSIIIRIFYLYVLVKKCRFFLWLWLRVSIFWSCFVCSWNQAENHRLTSLTKRKNYFNNKST